MANLKNSPYFQVCDQYYTPKYAWKQINHLIPKDSIVWEACLLGADLSKSKQHLIDLGNTVIGECDWDFFEKCDTLTYDLIVTNIPFDIKVKKPTLQKLVELDKPFIIIMNSMNIFSHYFNDIFAKHREHLQIVYPKGHMNFERDGELLKSKTSFYCVYVTYRLQLPNEKLYLD